MHRSRHHARGSQHALPHTKPYTLLLWVSRPGRPRQVPAVLLHQGTAPRVGVLRLHLRRADGAGVHQDLHLLPLSGQGLAQRARVGQAAGSRRRDRLHRAVQRVRLLRRPGRPAANLRPVRPRHGAGLVRALDGQDPATADRRRPRRRVLVGAIHAADRDLPHPGLRPRRPRPRVLRSAAAREHGPGPAGERRAAVPPRPAARPPSHRARPRIPVPRSTSTATWSP